MPTYEYKCEQCGGVFELRQKFSDKPLTTHAGCGGPVHRLISAAALKFKGSGWYVTDYGKSGSSPASSGNGGKDAGAGGDAAPKKESTIAPASSSTSTTQTKNS
jgi:putative FmdB family regulatory protein